MRKKIKPELNMDFFNRIREEIRKRKKMDDRSMEEVAKDTKIMVMALAANGDKWDLTLISNANEGLIDFLMMRVIKLRLQARRASGNLTPVEAEALKHLESHDHSGSEN